MNVSDPAFEWSEEGGVWASGGSVHPTEELPDEACDANSHPGPYWLLQNSTRGPHRLHRKSPVRSIDFMYKTTQSLHCKFLKSNLWSIGYRTWPFTVYLAPTFLNIVFSGRVPFSEQPTSGLSTKFIQVRKDNISVICQNRGVLQWDLCLLLNYVSVFYWNCTYDNK